MKKPLFLGLSIVLLIAIVAFASVYGAAKLRSQTVSTASAQTAVVASDNISTEMFQLPDGTRIKLTLSKSDGIILLSQDDFAHSMILLATAIKTGRNIAQELNECRKTGDL